MHMVCDSYRGTVEHIIRGDGGSVRELAELEEHIDEHEKKTGEATGERGIGPLVHNHEAEVAEDAHQEQNLGDEGKVHIQRAIEEATLMSDHKKRVNKPMVEEREDDTEAHMHDTEDDRQLHLEGVDERELVLGQGPDRVDTQGVCIGEVMSRLELVQLRGGVRMRRRTPTRGLSQTIWTLPAATIYCTQFNVNTKVWFVPRRGDGHRLGEEIVVQESGVHGEETHKENDVATTKERFPNLAS
jgi:hypothetical protein